MAWSTEISQLVTETEQFIDAVELKKIVLDTAANTALQNATAASLAANTAIISASLSPSVDISKGHVVATEAIVNFTKIQQDAASDAERQASLAAGYALSTGTIVQQDLSSVTAQLHSSPNAVTSLFVYDTSKDSDGGAWTEKGQNTSWYNEPLSGKWLGKCLTELAARTSGAVLGPNLVTNGTFDSGTTGWTATSTTLQVTNSMLSVPSVTTTTSEAYQLVTVVPGKLYEGRIDLISGIGRPRISDGGISNNHLVPNVGYGPQSFRFAFVPTTTTIAVRLLTELANSITVWDNISINEVTSLTAASNDYFQLTTDGKFYRLWKNLLTRTEEFNDGIWTKSGVTLTATSNPQEWYLANDGVGSASSITQNFFILANAVFSIEMKADTIRYIRLRYLNVTNTTVLNVDLQTGTSDGGVVTLLSDGFYRISIPYTAGADNAGLISIGISDAFDNAAIAPSALKRVIIRKPQLEYGSTATTYEAKTTLGTTSEVFRGNKRDFPRLAAIVAESANLTIYDLTEPGRPMWMRFNATITTNWWRTSTGVIALAILNGFMVVGTNANYSYRAVDFAKDNLHDAMLAAQPAGGIVARNGAIISGGPTWVVTGTSTVSAIAMTVLPDAPIDAVTGLKVPTIAIGTTSGITVIQDEGIARNGSGLSNVVSVAITPSVVYAGRSDGTLYYVNNPGTLGDNFGFLSRAETAAPGFAIGGTGNTKVLMIPRAGLLRLASSYSRVQMIYRNTIDIARSIMTTITNAFNTGWTVGDVRRAYLSDTILLPATETELVAYPDMSAVNVGWTENRGGTLVYDGNGLLVTNTTAFGGGLNIPLTLYNGDALRITMDIEASGTGGIYGGQVVSGFVFYNTVVGRTQVTIDTILTAPNPTVMFFIINGNQTLRVRYLSIKRLSPDRSYKKALASINGTLTRTQVASGASLVGYSGFSAANYLREPYSADLDFGTGEWNAGAWVNIPVTLTDASFGISSVPVTLNTSEWTKGTGWSTPTVNSFSCSGTQTAQTDLQWTSGSRLTANSSIIRRWTVVITAISGTLLIYSNNGNPFSITTPGTYYGYSNSTNGTESTAIIRMSAAGQTCTGTLTLDDLSPTRILDRAHTSGSNFRLGVNRNGQLTTTAFDGTTTRVVTSTASYNTTQWIKAEVTYTTDGSLGIRVNGREVAVTRGNPLLTLNSRYNLLSWSENTANAVWTNTSVTVSGSTLSFGISSRIYQAVSIGTPVTGRTYTVSAQLSSPTKAKISLRLQGTTTTSDSAFIQVNLTSTPTWYSVTRTFTSSDTSISIGLDNRITFGGDEVAGDVIVTGTQLEFGAVVNPYQRVTTVAETNVAPLTIGNSFALDAPFPGSLAMLKLGATVPTAEQSTFMYEQEKQLFRADAISVLPDGNTLVDMAYDDATDRWSTVSTTNESYWTGLVRNSATPVPAGSTYSKIDTTSGIELTARTGTPATTANPGADLTIPAYILSEDLNKRAEAASKAFKEIVNFDYVGGFTASTTTGSTVITSVANLTYPVSPVGARISGTGIPTNTTIVAVVGTTIYISAAATATATGVSISFLDFRLPTGFEAETVATAGAIRREGTTADFTRFFDGFLETIRFAVAPGVTTWVQIQASRIIS